MSQLSQKMGVDLRGRILNTPVASSNVFLPLFEAVVNSIHATDQRFGDEVKNKGLVTVRVQRLLQEELSISPGRPPVPEVTGFVVTDNGCGFTDANMKAFLTADTTAKAALGGKGVGRFTWLVVFSRAKIESIYEDESGKLRMRSFVFRISDLGIEEYKDEETNGDNPCETRIFLQEPQKRFKEDLRISVEMIAERLFEHCFSYFVVGRCPRIKLVEDGLDGTTTIDVNEKRKEINLSPVEPLRVGQHDLEVLHAQQKHTQGRKHTAHLCAHQRVVTSFPLSEISDLDGDPIRLQDGEKVVHHVYVSGSTLDEAVDSTRTRLDLPDGQPLLEQGGALDLKTLRQALGAHVDEHLADILRTAREENWSLIENHIQTEQPEYRHLLRHVPERLQKVKWTNDRRLLDERLYKEEQVWEAEIRRKQADVEHRLTQDGIDPDLLANELQQVLAEVNETGQANLVRYVVKRRAVLKFVRTLLSRNVLEEHIHKIVFPMRKTADEIQYDDHNLWLVDDTLSFYEHVASDIPFSQNKVAPTDSNKRPDLLAFKTGEPPYQHVALIELKRPDREDDNPVQQIVDYAVLLREGGAKNAQGITMPGIPKSVRIDAYALVTLTPSLEKRFRTGPGNMTKDEGDWRWVGSVPAENLVIEVLDFQAFVKRAEQRNRAFFVKLGLS